MSEATHPRSAITPEEREAFLARAIEQHRGRLFAIALSILRDRGDAEDAVQETFLRAWKSFHEVHGSEHSWITRICVNYCITRRGRALKMVLGGTFLQSRPAPDDPRLVGRTLGLDRAYRRLSPKQRAAIFLNYHFGYSVEECAVLMGCGAGSVRTHLARGLAGLRKEMTGA